MSLQAFYCGDVFVGQKAESLNILRFVWLRISWEIILLSSPNICSTGVANTRYRLVLYYKKGLAVKLGVL